MLTNENALKSQENFRNLRKDIIDLIVDEKILQKVKKSGIQGDREEIVQECKEALNREIFVHLKKSTEFTHEFFLKLQQDDIDLYKRLDMCSVDFKNDLKAISISNINVNIPEQIINEIYAWGISYFDKRDYENALTYFIGLSFLDSSNVTLTFVRGLTEKQLHKDQEAVGSFTAAIQQDPAYLPAYLFLVKSLLDIKEEHAARQILESVLHQLQDFPEVTPESLELIEELKKQLKI